MIKSIKHALFKLMFARWMPYLISNMALKYADRHKRRSLKDYLKSENNFIDQLPSDLKAYWGNRIRTVLDAPDNIHIPRVKNAGRISKFKLIMHNGIVVDPLSYYGLPFAELFKQSGGVHEPQEEYVFQEILKVINHEKPVMMELGAYWSFYSLWFRSVFPSSKNFMVEPDKKNLLYGMRNFRINNQTGVFIQKGISNKVDNSSHLTTVDYLSVKYNIDRLDILQLISKDTN